MLVVFEQKGVVVTTIVAWRGWIFDDENTLALGADPERRVGAMLVTRENPRLGARQTKHLFVERRGLVEAGYVELKPQEIGLHPVFAGSKADRITLRVVRIKGHTGTWNREFLLDPVEFFHGALVSIGRDSK